MRQYVRQPCASRHDAVTEPACAGAPNSKYSMRVRPTIAFRCISALLTGLLALACFGVNPVRAQAEPRQPVPIRFAFDRPIDARAPPVLLASASVLFGSEGLAVTPDIAGGSADAIARVASGAADFALADISELI